MSGFLSRLFGRKREVAAADGGGGGDDGAVAAAAAGSGGGGDNNAAIAARGAARRRARGGAQGGGVAIDEAGGDGSDDGLMARGLRMFTLPTSQQIIDGMLEAAKFFVFSGIFMYLWNEGLAKATVHNVYAKISYMRAVQLYGLFRLIFRRD